MFCKECGTQLPDGSAFCDNCGAKQDAAPPSGPKLPPAPDYVKQQTAPPPVNNQPAVKKASSNSVSSGDKSQKSGGIKKIILYVGAGIVALIVLIIFLGGGNDPDNNVMVDTYPENYVDKSPDSDIEHTETEEVEEPNDQGSVTETVHENQSSVTETVHENQDQDIAAVTGKMSQDEQKKIADELSTAENAYATEFDWLIDKVFDISKGEWANETDPEFCRRIEGDEAALLNGGWKCFIFEGDPGYYTGQYERYMNAVVDTDGSKFNITLNWNTWYTDTEVVEEKGQEVLKGKWDPSKATAHTTSGIGKIDFTDFYITHDNLREYAVGTLQWNSGEVDHIGLMRGIPMDPGSTVTPSSVVGLSDQETLLIQRAKKLSGAPEAEIEKNKDGRVLIHLFETVDDGNGESHTATWDWYTVDPKTMKGTNSLEEEIDLSK
ncbi:MAG: zinc ribbon domain-containing protein [Lachnospiraceae bacterium]|nr:zinc ribbon domain-containing protein [Lachnospiraceae bacterium]